MADVVLLTVNVLVVGDESESQKIKKPPSLS